MPLVSHQPGREEETDVRRGLTVAAAVVAVIVLAAAVLVGVRWWQDRDRTAFEKAASYAPADAERLTWTDWASVRDAVGAHVDGRSTDEELQGFLDDAFEHDLSSGSALVQSAPVLQSHFGFSPATADWELLSQSTAGAVVIVRLPD